MFFLSERLKIQKSLYADFYFSIFGIVEVVVAVVVVVVAVVVIIIIIIMIIIIIYGSKQTFIKPQSDSPT